MSFTTLWLAGCGRESRQVAPPYATQAPPILKSLPTAPTPADEGKPGVYERLPDVDPATRFFHVEAQDQQGARTTVLLVHTAYGLDGETRLLARDLAACGANVVAPDLFDLLEPTSRVSSNELLPALDPERMDRILDAALGWAKRQYPASTPALVGISIGGKWGYRWLESRGAISRAAFDSTALGSVIKSPRAGQQLLLMIGKENAAIPDQQREELKQRFGSAGSRLELLEIDGAGNDLFDHQTAGYSEQGRQAALQGLCRWLERP